jgi:hypothetical protein
MFMKYCLKCLAYGGRDCQNTNWCVEYQKECRYIKKCERFRQDTNETIIVFKGDKNEPTPMSEKMIKEIKEWNKKIDRKKKEIPKHQITEIKIK